MNEEHKAAWFIFGESVFGGLLIVLIFGFGCLGCTTAGNQFGYYRSPLPMNGMARYADPSRPVDSGQVAFAGINGGSGPYAAALGLGNIADSAARQDAAEVMKTVSENEYGYGYGRGRSSTGRGYGGGQFHEGLVYNSSLETVEVMVNGRSLGWLAPWGPGVGAESYRFLRLATDDYHNFLAVNRHGEVVYEEDFFVNAVRKDAKFMYPNGGRVITLDWVMKIP